MVGSSSRRVGLLTALLLALGAFGPGSAALAEILDEPPLAPDVAADAYLGTAYVYVLDGAVDPDGGEVTLTSWSQGTHGAVTCDAWGECSWGLTAAPADTTIDTDTFTYTVTDDEGNPSTGTVTVTFDTAPTAAAMETQAFSGSADFHALSGSYDADGGTVELTAYSQGTAGGVTCDLGTAWCAWTQTGTADSDTVTVDITDDEGNTVTRTVTVVIDAQPQAENSSLNAVEGVGSINVLELASDPDGGSVALTANSQGTDGTVTCNAATGVCEYTRTTPDAMSDSFTYDVTDDEGNVAQGTINVTVVPDAPPTATDDSAYADVNTPVTIDVLANDKDDYDTSVTIVASTNGTKGSVVCPSAGPCTYTPNTDAYGLDTFTYTIADSRAQESTATVTVGVGTCAVTTGACISNGTIRLGVNPEGHLNVPGGPMSSGIGGGIEGTTTVGLRYVPTGSDATAPGCECEGWGVADATTATSAYASATIGVANMAVNAFVPSADSVRSTVDTTNGLRVTHNYAPSTADNLYEVTVTVENLSGADVDLRYRRAMDWDVEPTAFKEYVTIGGSPSAALLFTSNDGFATPNPLAGPTDLGQTGFFTDIGPNDHGALFDFGFGTLAAGQTHSFKTYYGAAPNTAAALSSIETVGATVYSLGKPSTEGNPSSGEPNTFIFAFAGVEDTINQEPNAIDDTGTVAVGGESTVNVLANDTDPDGDTLSVVSKSDGAHGTVACTATACTYTASATTTATSDTFTYTISDGRGGSDTATVTMTLTEAANQAPDAVDDTGTVAVGGESTVNVLANDTDPDRDTLSVVSKSDGAHGTVACTATACTYTASATTTATSDTFTYTISDGRGGSDTATVTMTLTEAANQAPDAVNDTGTVAVGGESTVDVLANDTDPDSDTLSITGWTDGTHGTVACTATACTYTASATTTATSDTFTYTISDGRGGSDTATVTMTIEATGGGGDPLNAEDDAAETSETQPVAIDVLTNDLVSGPITTFTQGSDGSTVSCDAASCTYTPKTGKMSGTETFTYTIDDGATSDTATVTVTVHPCADVAGAISGQTGLVTGQSWVKCHSPAANGESATTTPMMPTPDGKFAVLTNGLKSEIDNVGGDDAARTEHRGANDVSILRLDLDVPATANCLTFDMVFASDEYPQYVGSQYNDAFMAELGESTWTVNEDATITAPNNFAKDGAGNIMSVNNAAFSGGGTTTETGTGWNGATGLLHASTPISAGSQTLFLSIFDQGDHILDSAAFVDRLRAVAVPDGDCASGVSVPPTGGDQTVATDEDTPLEIEVATDVDQDPLTIEILEAPGSGLAEAVDVPDGHAVISYDPDANWHGTDTFRYRASDGTGSVEGTITINVGPIDDHPVAEEVTISDGTTTGTFLIDLGISDVDDTNLAFEVGPTAPAQGTATPEPIVDGDCNDIVVAGYDTGTECSVRMAYTYTGTGAPTAADVFEYMAIDPDVTPAQLSDDPTPVELTRLESEPALVTVGFGTVPDPPTAVAGTAADGAVKVAWTAPAWDGGSPITGYIVTCSPAGSATVAPTATEATITGLTNNVEHTCSVVATNEFGDSAASSAIVLKPLDTTPPPSLTSFTLNPGLRKATLSWALPTSTDLHGLKILMKSGTTPSSGPTDGTVIFNKTKGQSGFAGPMTKSLLTMGTSYTFTAFTYDNAVQGANFSTPSIKKAHGTALTLTATPSTVKGIAAATLTGTLTRKATGVAVAGKSVKLFGRPKTGGAFAAIGTAKNTSDTGLVTFTHTPKRSYEYKLVFAGAGQEFGAESPRRTVLQQPKLTAALGRTSTTLGGKVKLTATITPSFAGETVVLQHKKGTGSWSNLDSTWVMDISGTKLTREYIVQPASRGTWYYRLTIAEKPNVHLAFTTGAKSLKVS